MFMTCLVNCRSHLRLQRKWKLSQVVPAQRVQKSLRRGIIFSAHFNKTKATSKRLLKPQQRLTQTIENLISKHDHLKKSVSEPHSLFKRTSSTNKTIVTLEEVEESLDDLVIEEECEHFNNNLTMEGQDRGAKPKKRHGHKPRGQKGQGHPEGTQTLRSNGQGHLQRGQSDLEGGESVGPQEDQGLGQAACRASGAPQNVNHRKKNDRRPKSGNKTFNGPNTSFSHKNNRDRRYTKPAQQGITHKTPVMSKEDIEAGMKSGSIIQGELRVKVRDYKTAYVSHPDGGSDVVIEGLEHRKPALCGDVVAIQIFDNPDMQETSQAEKNKDFVKNTLPPVENLVSKCEALDLSSDVGTHNTTQDCDVEEPDVIIEEDQTTVIGTEVSLEAPNKSGDSTVSSKNEVPLQKRQRKGKVVAVLERKHLRVCGGHIKPLKTKDGVLFSPTDNRLPRILLSLDSCPADILTRPEKYSSMLFAAQILDWKQDSVFAEGMLIKEIGEDKELEPRINAILLELGVDDSEFSSEVLESLPIQTLPWKIPEIQIADRRDFRSQCVFTIDPASARDLDDALSIEELPDGTYDVGVHIADVTFFLQEDTSLDSIAGKRATSVYLPHKVIPMLPRILCEELCSLNPDEDRLTFSVVWNMSAEGEIYDEWFGRTVIRSCTKLSYDHAQGFIDEPDKEWTTDQFPPISTNFNLDQIKKRVLNLNRIAENLRRKRTDHGALALNMPRMSFNLDDQTGMPNGFYLPHQKGSNRLVEEFMLLANMAVAHKINSCLPETALLRRHPNPDQSTANDMEKLSEKLGIPLDFSSSLALQQCLNAVARQDPHDLGKLTMLSVMCSKPMQLALYFCNGCIEDETLYHHFGLNVPLYTHFTSPIRRYADVMVHRALAAALAGKSQINMDKSQLDKICGNCNTRKKAAKEVSETCADVFFSAFIQETGPLQAAAMVTGFLDHSVDLYFLDLGFTKRVYVENLPLKIVRYMNGEKLILVWKQADGMTREITQTLTVFSKVRCTITKGKLPLSWMATLNRPEEQSVE